MEIIVTVDERRKLRTAPDPAVVKVGEPVLWIVRGPRLAVPLARWTIYFNGGWPFRMQDGFYFTLQPQRPFPANPQAVVTTRNTHLGTIVSSSTQIRSLLQDADADTQDVVDHSGTAGPFHADEEGDFKYGVRLVALNLEVREKDEVIDDDDPHLIVRR